MLFLILWLFLIGVFFFAFWCYWQRRRFSSLNEFKGFTPLPVLGNVIDIGRTPADFLANAVKMQKKFGSVYKVWLGPSTLLLGITDAKMAEFFLRSTEYLKKGSRYSPLQDWLGSGLLTSTGIHWQKRRKIITPAFHFKILEEFLPVFSNAADILIEKLSENANGDAFDIVPYVMRYTLDTICETAMGTKINAQTDLNNEYVAAVDVMRTIVIDRMGSAWKHIDFLFRLSKDYKTKTKSLNIIHNFVKSVIEKRRQYLLEGETQKESEEEVSIKKKSAFLDILLTSTIDGKPLTNDDIMEEVNTFMFEGHDTTGSAISFALYEIAKNKKIQDKIVEEITEIIGNENEQINLQNLQDMKYLERVIKETLRLYPAVPFYGREIEKDTDYNGTIFPKGVTVVIFAFGMHRNPELFDDPEKFDPDRFLPGNLDTQNPFAYVPFSAGPRNCVGQKFAMHELKISLSKILRHFELEITDPNYKLTLSSELILKSVHGIFIKLKKRKL